MNLKLDSLTVVAEKEEEGRWLDFIYPPTGELLYMGGQTEKPFRVRVMGSHSRGYARALKRAYASDDARIASAHPDDVDFIRDLMLLADVTLEWEACLDDEGNEIPFSPENVFAVYNAGSFVADKVNQATRAHASFFLPASPSL